MTAPQLWLLAGGNGAGKSTFHQQFLSPLGLPFVNADLIARKLDPTRPGAHAYPAARLAERLRYDLLHNGRSFCFETVFSHPSKIDFLAEARACNYETILVFIHLQNDELNHARVHQRVSEGGHDVPTNKIISRIPRTLDNVRRALPLADRVRIYDNSSASAPFRTLAALERGRVTALAESPPHWVHRILQHDL